MIHYLAEVARSVDAKGNYSYQDIAALCAVYDDEDPPGPFIDSTPAVEEVDCPACLTLLAGGYR